MKSEEHHDAELGEHMGAPQRGDAKAYSQLLERVTVRVRRIVVSRRGFAGREKVEDIVQDALLGAGHV